MKCQKCGGSGYIIKDELEQDASDMLWMLLGNAVHYVIEKGAHEEATTEAKIELQFDGVTVVCIPDIYHNKECHDYKITSVYSFLLGDKPEWAQQLNLNAYLLRMSGFEVNALKIYAILRDWQGSKVFADPDYPKIPFQAVDIPLWPLEGQERYLKARLEAHKALNPTCNDEERWIRPTTYAIRKLASKRALRVWDTKEEAEKHLERLLKDSTDKYSIEERKGFYTRCEKYCSVRAVCQQWQGEQKEI